MSRKGPRGLTPEDRELWDKVSSRTTPLPKASKGILPENKDLPRPVSPAALPKSTEFRIGDKAKPATAMLPGSMPTVQMDKKSYGRLKRGKLKPEGKIDLHGMTLAQAHPRLIGFITDAHANGKRLMLVITGKGKDRDDGGPIPTPRGILKHHVPGWLNAPPLKSMVLEVTDAHIRHGGGGAFYVYLRRRR